MKHLFFILLLSSFSLSAQADDLPAGFDLQGVNGAPTADFYVRINYPIASSPSYSGLFVQYGPIFSGGAPVEKATRKNGKEKNSERTDLLGNDAGFAEAFKQRGDRATVCFILLSERGVDPSEGSPAYSLRGKIDFADDAFTDRLGVVHPLKSIAIHFKPEGKATWVGTVKCVRQGSQSSWTAGEIVDAFGDYVQPFTGTHTTILTLGQR